MRLLAFVLLACACAGPDLVPRSAREGTPAGLRFWTAQAGLSNGARVVAYQIRDLRWIDLAVSYDRGGLDEPEGKAGLADVALAASGLAAGRGGITVEERHFALGAYSAQHVSDGALELTARVPPERLAEALAIERDRMATAADAVDDRAIAEVRDRYAAWLEASAADSEQQLRRVVAATRFRGPSTRAAPTPESIRAITPEDVRGFLRAHLRPDRAVVVVSGPTPTVGAAEAVAAAFDATLVRAPPVVPPQPAAGDAPRGGAPATVLRMPSDVARLWLAWPVDGLAHAARARLFADFVERAARLLPSNRVRRVSGVSVVERDHGVVLLALDLDDAKHAEELRGLLVPHLERASATWLRPAPRFARFDFFALERRGVAGVAEWLRATGDENVIAGYALQADADFGPGLAEAARETFAAGRAVAVVVEPTEQPLRAPGFGDEADRPWGLVPNPLAAAAPGASAVPDLVRPPGLDRARRLRLPNGLELVVLPHGSFPVVRGTLVLPTNGTPSFRDGTVGRIALQAARPRWGCWPPAIVARGDAVELQGETYSTDLAALIRSLACVAGMKIEKVDLSMARSSVLAERRGLAWDALVASDRAVFPGEHGAPDAAALVRGITDEEVRTWYARTVRPDRATLILAGDVVPDDALFEALRKAFGRWKAGPEPGPAQAIEAQPRSRSAVLAHFPGASRAVAMVRVAAPAHARRDPYAFETFRAHLEDRLQRSVLPRQGALRVSTGAKGAAAALGILLEVEEALLPGALRTVLDELRRAATAEPPAPAIDYARWATARELAFGFATLEQVTWAVARLAVHGLPAGTHEHAGADLAAVSPARVHEVARALAIGREAILVGGDAAKLEAPLRDLGLGVEVIRRAEPKR